MRIDFESVAQEHALGCGVACVASRCRISYRAALALFDVPDFAWKRGFFLSELRLALARAGHRYELVGEASREAFEIPGAIAFVEPCARYPAGHYLLRTE